MNTVRPDSPAWAKGVRSGDALREVNGIKLGTGQLRTFQMIIAAIRNTRPLNLTCVKIVSASVSSAPTDAAPSLGFGCRIDTSTKTQSIARYQHRASKYRGVTWNKNRLHGRGAWQAQIRDGAHVQWLGCFADELEAAQAYDAAAVKLKRTRKAILNFPLTNPVAANSGQIRRPDPQGVPKGDSSSILVAAARSSGCRKRTRTTAHSEYSSTMFHTSAGVHTLAGSSSSRRFIGTFASEEEAGVAAYSAYTAMLGRGCGNKKEQISICGLL